MFPLQSGIYAGIYAPDSHHFLAPLSPLPPSNDYDAASGRI